MWPLLTIDDKSLDSVEAPGLEEINSNFNDDCKGENIEFSHGGKGREQVVIGSVSLALSEEDDEAVEVADGSLDRASIERKYGVCDLVGLGVGKQALPLCFGSLFDTSTQMRTGRII